MRIAITFIKSQTILICIPFLLRILDSLLVDNLYTLHVAKPQASGNTKREVIRNSRKRI